MDTRQEFLLYSFFVGGVDEIAPRTLIADCAARLRADMYQRLRWLAADFCTHLLVMLVTKHVKIVSRTATHLISSLAMCAGANSGLTS